MNDNRSYSDNRVEKKFSPLPHIFIIIGCLILLAVLFLLKFPYFSRFEETLGDYRIAFPLGIIICLIASIWSMMGGKDYIRIIIFSVAVAFGLLVFHILQVLFLLIKNSGITLHNSSSTISEIGKAMRQEFFIGAAFILIFFPAISLGYKRLKKSSRE